MSWPFALMPLALTYIGNLPTLIGNLPTLVGNASTCVHNRRTLVQSLSTQIANPPTQVGNGSARIGGSSTDDGLPGSGTDPTTGAGGGPGGGLDAEGGKAEARRERRLRLIRLPLRPLPPHAAKRTKSSTCSGATAARGPNRRAWYTPNLRTHSAAHSAAVRRALRPAPPPKGAGTGPAFMSVLLQKLPPPSGSDFKLAKRPILGELPPQMQAPRPPRFRDRPRGLAVHSRHWPWMNRSPRLFVRFIPGKTGIDRMWSNHC